MYYKCYHVLIVLLSQSQCQADMSIAYEKYLIWHGLWILCNKTGTEQVARIMRFTRNNYHYKIRKMKYASRSGAKQSLPNALVSNGTRDYWSEIENINKSKIELISIVKIVRAHAIYSITLT